MSFLTQRRFLFLLLFLTARLCDAQYSKGLDKTFGVQGLIVDSVTSSAQKIVDKVRITPQGDILAVGTFLTKYFADGTIDKSYATNGILDLQDFFPLKLLFQSDILPQSDGSSLLHLQTSDSSYLVKLTSAGKLDATYAGRGLVPIDYLIHGELLQLADGSIIKAGNAYDSICVRRYTYSGKLDSSFGTNGSTMIPGKHLRVFIRGLRLDTAGNIFVAGGGFDDTGNDALFLVKLKPDGIPDSSFHQRGYFFPVQTTYSTGMALKESSVYLGFRFMNQDSHVIKISTAGMIDSSYGVNGIATITNMKAQQILIQSDDAIVCAGSYKDSFKVVRIQPGGRHLDPGFANAGSSTFMIESQSVGQYSDIAIQPDGKLVLGGQSRVNSFSVYRSVLARYLTSNLSVEQVTPAAITICPNPVTDRLCLVYSRRNISGAAKVIDITGRVLMEMSLPDSGNCLGLERLPAGQYILQIHATETRSQFMFTKL